ncbi:hypothetical protein [Modestobacter sp. SSW1-42]|uniref:hypothetical protein n=1 Tax=Modestobacter sp. SSW1-42 TaxID=596372 RepID=UPI0039879000
MATVHDHLPGVRGDDDRSPAVRDRGDGKQHELGFRQQIADGRWQLYALEVLVLLVVFGWMAVTNVVAGGHGPL